MSDDIGPMNLDLLERIPLTARALLDVGCGDGLLMGEFRRRNPATLTVGIEFDADQAALAAMRLHQVHVVDVEADPCPFGEQMFDVIVYNDILEHLADPWDVIRRQLPSLAPDGCILLCVPNLEHWSFTEKLLRGTWDYEESGLLDQTHLRWFRRQTLHQGLAQLGLEVQECLPRVFDRRQAEEFTRALAPGLRQIGVDADELLTRASALQYVFVAARKLEPVIEIFSTMLPPVGGVSHVRVIEPMLAMGSLRGVTTRVVQSLPPPPTDATPRIFSFHRPALLDADGLVPIRDALSRGLLLTCEFDDHPDYIPALKGGLVQNFRAVHAVQTSTAALADILRADNPEITVFANACARLPEPRNYADPERVTMFFAGINRQDDWPPYVRAINGVCGVVGERLHLRIVGDRGFFDALETTHKSFTPLCDYATYNSLLAGSDISFMPLVDNPFNRCKSDLKFIEAASHRVTALASPVAYAATIEDGRTGVLFTDPGDLRNRLLRLVVNPEAGRQLADTARRYVIEERMLAYQVAQRVAWYRGLWARKAELDAALFARVPELLGRG
jgi:SAM-dependent methyltransferase